MPSPHISSFLSALIIPALCWGPSRQVRATENGSVSGALHLPVPVFQPGLASSSTDTAYFTNDTINGVIGLTYTNVLGAFFFIVKGHIVPTSQLSPEVILGWQFEGPYTNILASPLGPGPNGFPFISPGRHGAASAGPAGSSRRTAAGSPAPGAGRSRRTGPRRSPAPARLAAIRRQQAPPPRPTSDSWSCAWSSHLLN